MEPMREQMVRTVRDLFAADERLVLLLADITRQQFDPILQAYPKRAVNVGIMEQTLVGVAAGMALEGFIPIVHTIAPFLVERPFEQLKVDFCYQRLRGSFISVGASHDYSTSGMTHHAPGDLQILRSLPGMQIVVPGTAQEFDQLLRASYANDAPTYHRLSVRENTTTHPVEFGKLLPIRKGRQATIVAVGPMLDRVLAAVADLDVSVLYCTTVAPFDREGLRAMSAGDTIITVEPGYAGALALDVSAALRDRAVRVVALGLAQRTVHQYGSIVQLDAAFDLNEQTIRREIDHLADHLAAGFFAQ